MECKAKGCKSQDVKLYATFCGIKVAYCKEHNYLFRELAVIDKMANGHLKRLKIAEERHKQQRIKHRDKQWKKYTII